MADSIECEAWLDDACLELLNAATCLYSDSTRFKTIPSWVKIDYSVIILSPENESTFVIENLGGFYKFEYSADIAGQENVTIELVTKLSGF